MKDKRIDKTQSFDVEMPPGYTLMRRKLKETTLYYWETKDSQSELTNSKWGTYVNALEDYDFKNALDF